MNTALNSTSDAVLDLLRQLGIRTDRAGEVTITFSARKPVKVEAEMFGDSEAVAAERERCAKLCDEAARGYQGRGMDMAFAASEWIAAAIRGAQRPR